MMTSIPILFVARSANRRRQRAVSWLGRRYPKNPCEPEIVTRGGIQGGGADYLARRIAQGGGDDSDVKMLNEIFFYGASFLRESSLKTRRVRMHRD